MKLFKDYKYFLSLIKSKKLNEKLIVIESDDWGSERIPNIKTREDLRSFGINIDSNPHLKYDTLERLEDLEIFETAIKDIYEKYGKKIKITTNFNVVNPDYDKIAASGYTNYFYQPFKENYFQRDKNHAVWMKIQEMIKNQIFQPQYHGREHVNVNLWLSELRDGNPFYQKAFESGCFAIDSPVKNKNQKNVLASLEYNSVEDQNFIKGSIIDGLNIFEDIFDFRSKTIVPTRHVWHTDQESIFKEGGITHIQTSLKQIHPTSDGYKYIYHHTGERNRFTDMRYLVRNIYFEPSYSEDIDWVSKSYNKIRYLLYMNIPVIISMHRINFAGGLDSQNIQRNVSLFKDLISKIIINYPEVEFISSDQLSSKLN